MARKGKLTDPLVIYDTDQANTAGSYSIDNDNKVSFSDLGINRGDNALNVATIQAKLGNIKHNGSVQIFVHGDGLGKIVINRREFSRNKLFTMLANAVNVRPALYPNIDITEVLLLACGGGNNSGSYQDEIDDVRANNANSPIANPINFASPLPWYQFGTGSIKMFDSGARDRPIPGTTIMLDKIVTRDKLKPNEHYYKAQI